MKDKYNRLKTLRKIGIHTYPCGDKTYIVECLCDCGATTTVLLRNLQGGVTKSCGCLLKEKLRSTRSVDHTGKKFNRLLALERIQLEGSGVKYRCLCDCGKEVMVGGGALQSNNTKSCGCLNLELIQKRNRDPNLILKRVMRANDVYKRKDWQSGKFLKCKGAFEANTVSYLSKNRIPFKWQIPFKLSDGRTYLIDMLLTETNTYVEIKGRWRDDAKEKFDLFIKDYPDLKVEVWDKHKLKQLGISWYRKKV